MKLLTSCIPYFAVFDKRFNLRSIDVSLENKYGLFQDFLIMKKTSNRNKKLSLIPQRKKQFNLLEYHRACFL